MKLIKLTLHNFQGIRHFEFEPNGEGSSIFGDNATGKTTLNSAFTWLLFGKDNSGKTDFAVETLDENGNVIHGIDHSVEGLFDIGREILTLKRNFYEVWGDKKGKPGLKWHTTDYSVDGVPGIKENEYKAKIASIIAEKTFRLLTDPRYFNSELPWLERREILIAAVGDVSNENVIATDKALVSLPDILGGHSMEDKKRIVKAREKVLNEELSFIPKRIDEVRRGLPEVTIGQGIKIAELKLQRNEKSRELVRIESGGEIAQKTKELRVLEAELLQIQKNSWLKNTEEVQVAKIESRKLLDKADDLKATIKASQRLINENNQEASTIEENIKALREEWLIRNTDVFYEGSGICPTCGQVIPIEAREKALAEFNRGKSQKLEGISNHGKRAKETLEAFRSENVKLEQEITSHREQLSDLEKKIMDVNARIAELESQSMDYALSLSYLASEKKMITIKNQIAELKVGNTGAIEAIQQEIQGIDSQIGECEASIAQINQREKGLARIEELGRQEKQLSEEKEKLQSELFIIDRFNHTRVEMLTEKINSKFQLARFKMFDIQVNGEIDDRMCESTYLGVPYASLNHGSQINVGLDIIRVLSNFYNFHPVVWIDRRESVTKIIPMDCQIVNLIVSPSDSILRVEILGKVTPKELVGEKKLF